MLLVIKQKSGSASASDNIIIIQQQFTASTRPNRELCTNIRTKRVTDCENVLYLEDDARLYTQRVLVDSDDVFVEQKTFRRPLDVA